MKSNAELIDALREPGRTIHANARTKGFWDNGSGHNNGEMIALQHPELSEALEALRRGNPQVVMKGIIHTTKSGLWPDLAITLHLIFDPDPPSACDWVCAG